MENQWYSVQLVYRIVAEGDPQYDEQWRLISASSLEEAHDKAEAIGRGESTSFNDHYKRKIAWEFEGVCSIYKIGTTLDGVEIHSRIVEPEDHQQYVEGLQFKKSRIKQRLNSTAPWSTNL